MEGSTPKFGGGATGTVLHPIVLVAMLLALVLFLVLPRRYVIVPVLISTFLIPLGQQFYVSGIHLFVYRILTLVGIIRARMSKVPGQQSAYAGGWNSIDTAFTYCVVISCRCHDGTIPRRRQRSWSIRLVTSGIIFWDIFCCAC